MASVWKHPQSKYFTACWIDGNGKRWKRSTKTTSKKLAEQLARKFEEESRGKRTARQARAVLADIYKKLSGEELPTMTVRDYFDTFVARKKPEVAPATLAYYTGNSKRFLAWLESRADADMAEITKSDLVSYRNFLATKTGPTSTNNGLKCLKAFFAAARKDGYIEQDPAENIDLVRDRVEGTRRGFSVEELQRLLAVANPEWKSMIRVGFYLGQRLGDVAVLRWSNFDLERNEVRLTTQKTGRKMAMPLPPPLRQHLDAFPLPRPAGSPLHPHAAATVERTGRSGVLSKEFAALLIKCGLRSESVAPEEGHARARHELSYHSLRHSATSILKDRGVPQIAVLSYIGHSSDAVSAGYSHVGEAAMRQAADAFPEL